MAEMRVLNVAELPKGEKKVVKADETEILLIHENGDIFAVEPKCPHAGAPLEKGAVCNGRLVCPWHMGTFALKTGELLEPPPMDALKTYPVRIHGDEIFVDPTPNAPAETSAKPTSDTPLFLLVGAGAASATAARTLRQEGFAGRIVAVDPITEEPVDRTQLTKQALSGKMPLAKLPLSTFAADHVERISASVVDLSTARAEATLSNGKTIAFDHALIATGGTPRRLDIPGADTAFTIRHPEDVRAILQAAEGKQHAVVIGTSFIGLEAASALTENGLHVTVAGKEKLPFAKKFGEEVATAIHHLHESKGIHFHLGVEIARITPESVITSTGSTETTLPADLVIMGVGVEPELSFHHDLPLAPKSGGIAVTDTLRAAATIWVAGDIANVNGTRIEHWRLAQQHGRAAAIGMLGKPSTYNAVPFFWTTHFGKRFGYLGHANDWDEIVTDGTISTLEFIAFYLKAGHVAAILTCGRDHHTAILAETMRSNPTIAEARKAIS